VRPRSAESWRRLKKNIARPITAILVLNTVAHTAGATVAAGTFVEIYGERSVWIFSVLFTVVILFGTEILPKILGVTFRNQLAPVAGPILEFTTKLMHPLVRLSELLFQHLASENESEQITTADVVTLASLARAGKAINLDQENIITNAIRLGHAKVTRAMIPPERIRFVSRDDTPEALLAVARESGHTRYPVSMSKDVKDIYAYIVIKKAVPVTGGDLKDLVGTPRPIQTISYRATLLDALQTLLQKKEHLLAVVNGQNHCVGIVTMEDIAGELLSADIEQFK
jgi:CBS domain containing-hemolysin-like protein